jgi:hypothetical protein
MHCVWSHLSSPGAICHLVICHLSSPGAICHLGFKPVMHCVWSHLSSPGASVWSLSLELGRSSLFGDLVGWGKIWSAHHWELMSDESSV